MEIAFLARSLNLIDGGGSNFSLNAIATELTERNHNVDVFTTHSLRTRNEVPYHCEMVDYNENTTYVSRFRRIANLRSSLLDEYDVAHIFNPAFLPPIGYSLRHTETETFYVGRLNTYTLICSNFSMMDGYCHRTCGMKEKFVHSSRLIYSNIKRTPRYFTQTFIEPNFVSNIDRLFAISPQVQSIYEEYGYHNRIDVVPNFAEQFEVKVNKSRSSEPPRLLYVGRIEPQKGIEDLLKAVQLLERPVHVDIVGKGSQLEELKTKYSKIDNGFVEFHGHVSHNDISSYYIEADLFVHPGRWPEPFGRSVLEALQHDTPALVSNIGAPPWIIGDAGDTFMPRNPNSLANKIRYLLDDKTRLTAIREKCEKQVNRFSKDEIINRIESIYLNGVGN